MKTLLLAGSGEARKIAQFCKESHIDAVATLAGATRQPMKLVVETVVGGFGGEVGFLKFLQEQKIERILDMTHPFAHQITLRTSKIAHELGMPYLRFDRAPWLAEVTDNWIEIEDESQAREHVKKGATVFLATGRQTLHKFDNLSDCKVICRQIDPPVGPFPFPNGHFQIGRPPFSKEDEILLFRNLEVDALVVKNAGGAASRSKLDAARALNLPVLMIKRPPLPKATITQDIAEVRKWLLAE